MDDYIILYKVVYGVYLYEYFYSVDEAFDFADKLRCKYILVEKFTEEEIGRLHLDER